MPTLNQLAKSVDLLNYIEQDPGLTVTKVGSGTHRVDPCPVCGGYDHFTVYEETNTYYSFSDCCKGGTIIDYMMQVEEKSFDEAADKVRELAGVPSYQTMTGREVFYEYIEKPAPGGSPEPVKDYAEIIKECEDLTSFITRLYHNSQGDSYFKDRGIPEELITKYKLATDHERAYFPVWYRDSAIYYTARALTEGNGPKYKNAKGDHLLFNGHLLIESADPVIVTEGIADALAVESATGREAVALLGAAGKNKVIDYTERSPERPLVFVLTDNDQAGETLRKGLESNAGAMPITMPDEYKDPAEWAQGDAEGMKQTIEEAVDRAMREGSTADYLERGFLEEMDRSINAPRVKTGFTEIDRTLNGGLYPGLHVIGGKSGMGKTAIAVHIADKAAAQGVPVLYVSLEMSRYDLVCRSLSRVAHEAGERYSYSQIIAGDLAPGARQYFVDKYAHEIKNHLYILEGDFNLTVEGIRAEVERKIQRLGKPPLVVVDYLQVLQNADPKLDAKSKIDHNMKGLKIMSRDLAAPVVVISSFNRESNKRNNVSLESASGSGGIEYTADTVIGLDSPNDDEIPLLAGEYGSSRLIIQVLKNRQGPTGGRIGINYHKAYNRFTEGDE